MKVSIIGMGQVGSTLAYSLMLKGVCEQLVLVSRSKDKAEGEAFDLRDARMFVDSHIDIESGDTEMTAGSDVIVVTTSEPWKEGFKDRLDAAAANTKLFTSLIPPLAERSPDAIFVIISNPVDVLTWHTIRLSGFDESRVIGTGTLIDSARFRTRLSDEVGVHPSDLHAHVLGEHGNSQFAALSVGQAGGERIEDTMQRRKLAETSMRGGYEVFERKGNTNFAIASATTFIINAIARDAKRIMPVSTKIEGFLGIDDVCLSLPCVIGRRGIERKLYPELNNRETTGFIESARVVREAIVASS